MKSFRKLFAAVLALTVLLVVGANAMVRWRANTPEGRPYRVEISRLEAQIRENGLLSLDLSGAEYVTNVVSREDCPEKFYRGDSDCVIREINGELYRFDYTVSVAAGADPALMNGALLAMALMVLGVLLYVRQKILLPFERMSEVPIELSKGNLTVPIREEKSRLFGRFAWGIDLLRENMEQQKQALHALQKDRQTLLLSLSHDIKTPLSTIKLYARALSKGLYPDPEKQLQIARSIDEKADEIEAYMSQIVRASSGEIVDLPVRMGEFYLSELVRRIEYYYRDKLAVVKTEFRVGSYNDCLLSGDLDRSIEVLQNLLENAVKYGDGARIALEFSREEECVLICVRNSGCTLPEGELPHIFDSFWRGSNAENRGGSGLGLYICRQLMHKMNGEIFAQVREGDMLVTAVFNKL